MPIISFHGIRGGVGTTSIVASLAWALAQLNESVLVVDLCPNNMLRLHFNADIADPQGWAYGLINQQPWHNSAYRYLDNLFYLPFGQLNSQQLSQLLAQLTAQPNWLTQQLALLSKLAYRWILLDLPSALTPLWQQGIDSAEHSVCLLNADAACHILLHQQPFPAGCHFLLNQFMPSSQLQKDLSLLWSSTYANTLPLLIHRDEALAEALAMKQSVGQYGPHSLAAQELNTLANWCLIHCQEASYG